MTISPSGFRITLYIPTYPHIAICDKTFRPKPGFQDSETSAADAQASVLCYLALMLGAGTFTSDLAVHMPQVCSEACCWFSGFSQPSSPKRFVSRIPC